MQLKYELTLISVLIFMATSIPNVPLHWVQFFHTYDKHLAMVCWISTKLFTTGLIILIHSYNRTMLPATG
jgi:hypothetical protein